MKKVRISTNQAVPGMVTAENIYTFNNQLVISIGTTLTDKAITRLKFYSIRQLHVYAQEEAPSAPPATPVQKTIYSEKVRKTPEFKDFNNTLQNTAASLKKQFLGFSQNNESINPDDLYKAINNLIKKSRNGSHLFDMIHCLRDFEDETFVHCVNVALISNTLARWLNFGKKDVETATLSGLLHDIGKLAVPKELIKKEEPLTDEEMDTIRTHAVLGYNMLKDQDLSIHVKMAVMMHHECCDGSGYPMGLKSDQIDRFAKLVMIADVYDAMTSARVYRGALCPFEVLSMFTTEGLTKFDPKYLMTFTEHVYETYLGNTVRLSNNETGTIILMNHNSLAKPVVKINEDRYIDLTRADDVYIQSIL